MREAYRVVLIYPPSRTQQHHSCPVGLLSLGAALERAGHEVHLLDANAVNLRRGTEEMAAAALALKPDVVGMTLLTPLVREGYRLATLLRAGGARLIAGGPHATLLPEEPLAHGFDAVGVGEGELTIDGAVRALMGEVPCSEVPNLLWRGADGALQRSPTAPPPADLDALPLPARHLANPDHYDPISKGANVFTSRGCTARCTYCAGGLFGKRFRFRSARNVLDEVLAIHARHGTKRFHFCDDSMSLDEVRMREICRGIKEANLGITWSMMTRIDGVDEELLRLCAEAGCVAIDYGVESGSPATLRKIRKPHTAEMVRRIVPLTKAAGIKPQVFFILGFPWEEASSIEETRKLMEDLSPYVERFHPALGSVLVPFPGTEIYEAFKDQYGFHDWWLGDARNFDAPREDRHAYWERVVFRSGTILDADFFRYPPAVRRQIVKTFQFMFHQNLRGHGAAFRAAHKLAFAASLALSARWPKLERQVFGRRRRDARAGEPARA